MKSRQWRELLAATGGEFLNALPPEEREEVRRHEARRVALEAAYNRARYSGQRDEMARINDEIKATRQKRLELTRNRTVDAGEVPSADAVSSLLPGDWALADYYVSSELSFAILLKHSGTSEVIPLDVDYDSLFGYSYWMRFVGEDQSEYDENKFPGRGRPRVTACGLSPEDVAERIFKPVADACGDIRKLMIVPHDILYVLPFEALQQKREGKVSFLISEWTFAELPSAFLLTREKGSSKQAEKSLLLVANPAYASLIGEKTWASFASSLKMAAYGDADFKNMLAERLGEGGLEKILSDSARGEEQAEISNAMADIWKDILSETERVSSLASVVKNDFGPVMRPLNSSQSEADDLKRIWSSREGGEPTLLVATHASEGEFWDNDPGKYAYVHIACHGYDRGSIPDLQPGLALSPLRDPGNDSFLQMGELSTVKWNAELITLSACETGLGDLYVGDGMLGLSTVLLAGGAKGAVLTRWRAVDDSASVFMREFYAGMLDGKPCAEALRSAQLSLLEGDSLREPRHWAIFKYVGIPW
jgi:CHAT domain-containing protein